MTVKLEDRPIEKVREEVVDKLIFNYSHGVISAEAFERRLDDAMAATEHQAIVDLATDLTMDVDKTYASTKELKFSPNYGPSGEEEVNLKSVFGTIERSGQWQVPKRIKILNMIGSTKLDFTDAIFHHQHVTVEITSALASDEIFVPENVNVVCKAFGVISSIDNKCPSIAQRQGPTITIEGKSFLGSLEIKVKRTIKEKLLAFADQLKSTFS
jgi:hypothetical protein